MGEWVGQDEGSPPACSKVVTVGSWGLIAQDGLRTDATECYAQECSVDSLVFEEATCASKVEGTLLQRHMVVT